MFNFNIRLARILQLVYENAVSRRNSSRQLDDKLKELWDTYGDATLSSSSLLKAVSTYRC